MKRSLTAAEIKTLATKMANRQVGKPDSSWPYHMKAKRARVMTGEALAYLSDERYEVSPRSAQTVRDWSARILSDY